jgi:hypothetical protein
MPEGVPVTSAAAAPAATRRRFLVAVAIGWFILDVFDGLVVPEEAREHWLEAAFWPVAIVGYLLLARRRPVPATARVGDWVIAGGMASFGGTLVLRATLPDAIAFRGSMVLVGAFVAAALLLRQSLARSVRQPQH